MEPFKNTNFALRPQPIDNPRILSGHYWGELRIFLAVAKAKSFNRAAENLNISQPTVSRQVRRLQDLMGSQLVVSSQHGVTLTSKGKDLAAILLALDQTIFSISNDLRAENREDAGVVLLAVSEGLAGFFVAPALVKFADTYPNIQLHLKTPCDLNGLKNNQTDLMIGFAPVHTADVSCTEMGVLNLIPVASRSYIAKFGLPTRSNVENHLFVNSDIYSGGNGLWNGWSAIVARGTTAHRCDSSFAYGLLVRSGVGIGLLGSYALADQELVPLELGVRVPLPLHVISLADRMQARPVRIVHEWLCQLFSSKNPWFQRELNLTTLPTPDLAETLSRLIPVSPNA
jgi:DNA-binding transcriptional LysR family regulator